MTMGRGEATFCSTSVVHKASVVAARVVGAVCIDVRKMDKISVEEESWTRLSDFAATRSVI